MEDDMLMNSNKRHKHDGIEDKPYQLHSCSGLSTVSVSQDFPGQNIKLFELPSEVLKMVKSGEKLKIVGPVVGDAVLCSQNMTFSIKKVETSNSVFIVPPSANYKFEITSKCDHYFELVPIRGKIDQIPELLTSTKYVSSESAMIADDKLYSKAQLEALISASNVEIEHALKKLHVVEVGQDRKLRMLDRDTLYETTRLVLDTIIENAWPIDNVNIDEIISRMDNVDSISLTHILESLGERVEGSTCIWRLDERAIARSTADMLFRFNHDHDKPWPADDFLNIWASRTPGQGNPSEELLLGIAVKDIIIRGHSSIPAYLHLPEEDLPMDVRARFAAVYAKKARYTASELAPYLRDFYGGIGQPKSLVELALLYTRIVDDHYLIK